MREVKPRDRCTREHGIRLGQTHTNILCFKDTEHICLNGVLRASRVAGRGSNTAILLTDQLLIAEFLICGIAP